MRGDHNVLVTILQLGFELVLREESELNLTHAERDDLTRARYYLAVARQHAEIYRCARRSHDFDAHLVTGNYLVTAEENIEQAEELLRPFRLR